MKIIKIDKTVWYLKDDYELLQAKIAISLLELQNSVLPKMKLVTEKMPPQPANTFWLEDTEYVEQDVLYITRKWVKKEDMIWMESL